MESDRLRCGEQRWKRREGESEPLSIPTSRAKGKPLAKKLFSALRRILERPGLGLGSERRGGEKKFWRARPNLTERVHGKGTSVI